MKIEINEGADSKNELVEMLKHITDLVEQGHTNGNYPSWRIVPDDCQIRSTIFNVETNSFEPYI